MNLKEKFEYVLRWQPLIETDRNVLQSVETSLKNPTNSATLFHSCEFFVNVLLHDFPAEVFIQRPGIITVRFFFYFIFIYFVVLNHITMDGCLLFRHFMIYCQGAIQQDLLILFWNVYWI